MKELQHTPNKLIDSIHLNNTWNQNDENDAKFLGEGIAKCVTLTSLKLILINNNIGENGAKCIIEGIGKCVTLTSLHLILINNSIGENGTKYLIEGI